MRENEFEKQLKNMMDEFEVTPSKSVWEKVSRRINLDKRKKRPFIFWLITGLLISGSGYFIYHTSENKIQPTNNYAKNTIKDANADSGSLNNPGKSIPEKNTEAAHQNMGIKEEHANKIQQKKDIHANTKNSDKFIANSVKINKPVINKPDNNDLDNYKNDVQQQQKNQTTNNNKTIQPAEELQGDVVSQQQQSNFENKQGVVDSSNTVAAFVQENKSLPDSNTLNKEAAQKNATSSQNKTPTTIKNNYVLPKWQFGAVASYGKSNIVEGISSNNNKSLPAYLDNLSSAGGGNFDSSSGSNKPFSSSGSYQFGVVAQRKIIKNGFISSGLNFIHLSAKADIKNKIDSPYTIQTGSSLANTFYVNSFYQAGSAETYTSTYNFIELPVYFQQDLWYKHTVSLSYNTGFSVRQLLSSNALIYNKSSNIYYTKDDLLRKTQWQFLAALNLKINTGKSTSIYLGPQFSYSLSSQLKNSSNDNFHYINYGLQAGLMFHKK